MIDSFTFVEHDKLAAAIDAYEDLNVNKIINRAIKRADETKIDKSWFRRKEYTIDESLDRLTKKTVDSWGYTASWSIQMVQRQANEFRQLLNSGNGAYIGARDAFILTYIE